MSTLLTQATEKRQRLLHDPRTNWKYVVIVVVLGLVVGVGIWWYYVQTFKEASPPQIIISQPTPTSTPESIDTSTWQTYRNDEFGFEVRYPEESLFLQWKSHDGKQGTLTLQPITAGGGIALYDITIFASKIALLEKLFPYSYKVSSTEEIRVAGIDTSKEIWQGDGGVYLVVRLTSGDNFYYRIQGNFATQESFEKFSELYDQILSTFRFVE